MREVPSLHPKNIVEGIREQVALTRNQDEIVQGTDVSSIIEDHTMNKYLFQHVIEGIRRNFGKLKGTMGRPGVTVMKIN